MFQTVFTKCIGELGLVQRSSFAVSSLNSLSFDYGDDEDNSNNNKKGFGWTELNSEAFTKHMNEYTWDPVIHYGKDIYVYWAFSMWQAIC